MKNSEKLKTVYLKLTNIFYFSFKPNIWNCILYVTKPKSFYFNEGLFDFSMDSCIEVLHSKVLCSVQQAGIKPTQTINVKSSYLCSYPLLFCGHTAYSYPNFYTLFSCRSAVMDTHLSFPLSENCPQYSILLYKRSTVKHTSRG